VSKKNAMPSPVTVRIKVPRYIRKYMLAQSENMEEPLVFPKKHIYNISLVQKLSNYNYLKYIPIHERHYVYEYFYHPNNQLPTFEYVSIALPFNERKNVHSFNYLGLHSKYRFVKEVKEDFYFELTRYIIKMMRQNVQRKDSIAQFLEFYEISEDDIKFETLYRQSTRILEPFF
jgi:hypothetical protein